jgi:hypothetical protein
MWGRRHVGESAVQPTGLGTVIAGQSNSSPARPASGTIKCLFRGNLGGLFVRTGPGQDADQAVIPLVARVLVDRFL